MREKRKREIQIPQFIVFAFIVMLAMIAIIYYMSIYVSPEEIIPYEGYAVSGKEITENLLNTSYEGGTAIKLIQIEEQEMLYKRLNTYYVGKSTKQEINLDYPVYINDNIALYNLSQDNILITKNFKQISSGFRNTLSEGILYNEGDLERADQNTYIFIKNEKNIFVNLSKLEINTQYNNYEIQQNSLIYFYNKGIAYYTNENGELTYHRIEDIDASSKIKINEDEYEYDNLLIKLGLKKAETETVTESEEEVIVEGPDETEEQEKTEEVKKQPTEVKTEEKTETTTEETNENTSSDNDVVGDSEPTERRISRSICKTRSKSN